MKKGQVYEGVIESVEFPNKGIVNVSQEDRRVIVKNGVPGQKVRFSVNKVKKGKAEGKAEGEAIGETRMRMLINRLIADGRMDEIGKIIDSAEACRELYKEYGL